MSRLAQGSALAAYPPANRLLATMPQYEYDRPPATAERPVAFSWRCAGQCRRCRAACVLSAVRRHLSRPDL
jgi:hypothetical protein